MSQRWCMRCNGTEETGHEGSCDHILLSMAKGGFIGDRGKRDAKPMMIAPGEIITDPERARALGLTADARRMEKEQAMVILVCPECGYAEVGPVLSDEWCGHDREAFQTMPLGPGYQKGDILPVADGGFIRVINPAWPHGDEPFCERVDEE